MKPRVLQGLAQGINVFGIRYKVYVHSKMGCGENKCGQWRKHVIKVTCSLFLKCEYINYEPYREVSAYQGK
jgi:hypothetical protein